MKTSMWSIMMISTVALSAYSADTSPVDLQKQNSPETHSMIKDYGLKDYIRVSKDLPHSEGNTWKLVCTMPYNCHFQPWIQVESPEGYLSSAVRTLHTDNTDWNECHLSLVHL